MSIDITFRVPFRVYWHQFPVIFSIHFFKSSLFPLATPEPYRIKEPTQVFINLILFFPSSLLSRINLILLRYSRFPLTLFHFVILQITKTLTHVQLNILDSFAIRRQYFTFYDKNTSFINPKFHPDILTEYVHCLLFPNIFTAFTFNRSYNMSVFVNTCMRIISQIINRNGDKPSP